MSTVKHVARRIEHELGLSRTVSVRIAKKLNALAGSVGWAIPLEDGAARGMVGRRAATASRLGARPSAARKARRKAPQKKRRTM